MNLQLNVTDERIEKWEHKFRACKIAEINIFLGVYPQ